MSVILSLLGTAITGNKRLAIQGQSNAVGVAARSDLSASPLSSDAGLAAFDASGFSRVKIWNDTAGQYETLAPGSNQQAIDAASFGPEFGIAVRWMRETASGTLYIDKQAASSQAISYFQSGGGFFAQSQSRYTAASTWLSTRSITADHVGYLWVQGETDYLATQADYYTALQTLIGSRVSAGLQPASAMVVLAQMAAGTSRYGAGVAAAKQQWADADSRGRIISPPAYMNVDNLHWSGRGQVQLGYDAFAAVFRRGRVIT